MPCKAVTGLGSCAGSDSGHHVIETVRLSMSRFRTSVRAQIRTEHQLLYAIGDDLCLRKESKGTSPLLRIRITSHILLGWPMEDESVCPDYLLV